MNYEFSHCTLWSFVTCSVSFQDVRHSLVVRLK
jgi:hypothetical protein